MSELHTHTYHGELTWDGKEVDHTIHCTHDHPQGASYHDHYNGSGASAPVETPIPLTQQDDRVEHDDHPSRGTAPHGHPGLPLTEYSWVGSPNARRHSHVRNLGVAEKEDADGVTTTGIDDDPIL